MTPPEDKAPDMPLLPCPFCGGDAYPCYKWSAAVGIYDYGVSCARCGARVSGHECGKDARDYWNTRPIQSPDQGAVEALQWLDEYLQITVLTSREEYERRWKNVHAAKKYFKQALTRPPLDLAGLKAEILEKSRKQDEAEGAPYGETSTNIFAAGILYALDHLQAIRPDLFGGK